jgi:hypothetical protein
MDKQRHDRGCAVSSSEQQGTEQEIATAKWQELEARWRAVLAREATMDALRMSMESLASEMEAAYRKPLTMEEKTYALRSDIAAWEQAKNRVHLAVPKMKDFIRRAIWALGAPERKRLEERYTEHIQPQIAFPNPDEVLKQLEDLRKDRQVLCSVGKTVYQESRTVCTGVQSALRTLQSNTHRKKSSASSKGNFFKKSRG